jgi:hypothetical protein
MELTIKIRMNSGAFEDAHGTLEVARILDQLATTIKCGLPWLGLKIRDIDGNVCGELIVKD